MIEYTNRTSRILSALLAVMTLGMIGVFFITPETLLTPLFWFIDLRTALSSIFLFALVWLILRAPLTIFFWVTRMTLAVGDSSESSTKEAIILGWDILSQRTKSTVAFTAAPDGEGGVTISFFGGRSKMTSGELVFPRSVRFNVKRDGTLSTGFDWIGEEWEPCLNTEGDLSLDEVFEEAERLLSGGPEHDD